MMMKKKMVMILQSIDEASAHRRTNLRLMRFIAKTGRPGSGGECKAEISNEQDKDQGH